MKKEYQFEKKGKRVMSRLIRGVSPSVPRRLCVQNVGSNLKCPNHKHTNDVIIQVIWYMRLVKVRLYFAILLLARIGKNI